ncbi:MAG: hydroxyacylglutathione hydrolase [Oleiphilaceae bacterium]|nr:hydroxyacylglutathione hydrolase [Oleiphilaceae bacterium]
MLQITPIRAFQDNYIWCISDAQSRAVLVDPGSADAALTHLKAHKLNLHGILVTHHHPDHVGGIAALLKETPCPVIGFSNATYPGITQAYDDGESFVLMGTRFEVIGVPGHTLDHIAFYSPADTSHPQPWLFCGDTLFSGGCGRLFEGTPAQMHESLARLMALPDETLVFCAHEYTLANLKFARHILPDDQALASYQAQCERMRSEDTPTIPSTIAQEKKSNIFLRCDEQALAHLADTEAPDTQQALRVFTALRRAKDTF